jgi:glycosyltransferase involved in cell wall biosynthesis
MKVLTINSAPYGSVARISVEVAEVCEREGIENRVAFGYSNHPIVSKYIKYRIANFFECAFHIGLMLITGLEGVFSVFNTLRFLKYVKHYNPDVIHIHNLHGCYINIPLLINYVKKHDKPVVMTLHDCWDFTGRCPHFEYVGCDKWQTECNNCPLNFSFPQGWVDNSRIMHRLKKKWFDELPNLTIVTPSIWLANQVRKSFLGKYHIRVINNGINLNIFKKSNSEFRTLHKIESSFVILGVAFGWDHKKGLDSFVKLAERLPEDCMIVLVGTIADKSIVIPPNVITIGRTQNQRELAELYSTADVFVNLTREDTFPTVNIEALACGLPVVTFNTGGSPEIIDKKTGAVIEKDNINKLFDGLMYIKQNRPYNQEDCIARAKLYNKDERFLDYVKLYRDIYQTKK